MENKADFGEEIAMFYDLFIALCREKGICPSRAVEAIGMNRASAVKWKNGTVPGGATLHKLAEYFGGVGGLSAGQ